MLSFSWWAGVGAFVVAVVVGLFVGKKIVSDNYAFSKNALQVIENVMSLLSKTGVHICG
jgi:hypothetical protein